MKTVRLILALVILATLCFPAAAGETKTYQWTPSSGGTKPLTYHAELSYDGGPFIEFYATTDTFLTYEFDFDKEVVIRIVAEDADGRRSPYSESSDPQMWASPPTACGKPTLVSN